MSNGGRRFWRHCSDQSRDDATSGLAMCISCPLIAIGGMRAVPPKAAVILFKLGVCPMTKRETISTGPVATFQDHLIDWHCEQVMDGKVDEVIVSRSEEHTSELQSR